MQLTDFDYHLPKELIAQKALVPKDSSRLMVLSDGKREHKHFRDLIDYLKKDDVLVLNETKVSRAKIEGRKTTGSKAELILCKKISPKIFECRLKGSRLKIGTEYVFNSNLSGMITSRNADIFTISFNKPLTKKLISEIFELPTPPYIKRRIERDSEYQTVYAKKEGSLAAPTAGLHFTENLLRKIRAKGVIIAKICLHVDFSTFLPVHGDIIHHKMHDEYFEIDKKNADIINNRKGRLIAVGTTVVRTLESASDRDGKIIPLKSRTSIFIYPGYRFKTQIDVLITNLHFPKSTLLMLVSAYYGREKILSAYHEAIREKYRFYSLGDAMMLIK